MKTGKTEPIDVLTYDTYRDSVVPRRIQVGGTERNIVEVLNSTIEETEAGDRFQNFLVRVEGGDQLRLAHDLRRHTWTLLRSETPESCRG